MDGVYNRGRCTHDGPFRYLLRPVRAMGVFGNDINKINVFKMLKEEGKIADDLIRKLMSWRHSGFSVHNGVRVRRDDDGGRGF